MLGHAKASHREAGEHAHGVHADQDVQLSPGHDQERLGGDGEDDDPVREHEPVAPAREAVGEERVLRDEAGEVREPVEARVAAGPQDQHRGGLHEKEPETPVPARAEDVLRFLGEHSRAAAQIRNGVGDVGEERDPRHERAEDDRHDDEHPSGVGALGLAEVGDAVRDRLEACQRGPAVGEGAQHDDDPGPVQKAAPGRTEGHDLFVKGNRLGVQLAEGGPDEADDDERSGGGDEQVRRQGEDTARFTDPAQVAVAHDGDDHDRDLDIPVPERGEGGGHGVGPRRHLHGDCHDVVDDQGHCRDLCHLHAEVLPGHDVGAAGSRVDHDDLSVRERHEEKDDYHGERDGQKEGEGGDTYGSDEHEKDLLGSIGGGGDAVRGQHAQRHGLAQALDREALCDERRSQQCFLQTVGERLGQDDGFAQLLASEPIPAGAQRRRGCRWGWHLADPGLADVVDRSARHDHRAYFVTPGS